MKKDKAVFLAATGMVEVRDLHADIPSATINSQEWKALRLLTLAGYTIVLFIPERSAVYAECRDMHRSWRGVVQPAPVPGRQQDDLSRHITPLLQATASLQIDLTRSWMVGDRLDSIEVGRLVGCKTLLLTDGSETDWDMTDMRWPDLIAGDLWEIACLIVMSDGSSVAGLSADVDEDE